MVMMMKRWGEGVNDDDDDDDVGSYALNKSRVQGSVTVTAQ